MWMTFKVVFCFNLRTHPGAPVIPALMESCWQLGNKPAAKWAENITPGFSGLHLFFSKVLQFPAQDSEVSFLQSVIFDSIGVYTASFSFAQSKDGRDQRKEKSLAHLWVWAFYQSTVTPSSHGESTIMWSFHSAAGTCKKGKDTGESTIFGRPLWEKCLDPKRINFNDKLSFQAVWPRMGTSLK